MIVTSNPRKGVVIMNKPLVFTLGAAVGAVAALLLSPNSGERNREIVADKVDYYTAHGEQVFQQTADTVRNKVRGVADVATNADADDIREKINEARDRIAEQITRNSSVPQDVARRCLRCRRRCGRERFRGRRYCRGCSRGCCQGRCGRRQKQVTLPA